MSCVNVINTPSPRKKKKKKTTSTEVFENTKSSMIVDDVIRKSQEKSGGHFCRFVTNPKAQMPAGEKTRTYPL